MFLITHINARASHGLRMSLFTFWLEISPVRCPLSCSLATLLTLGSMSTALWCWTVTLHLCPNPCSCYCIPCICLSSCLTPQDAAAALGFLLLLEESVASFRIRPLDTSLKYRIHSQHQTASEKHEGAQQGLHTSGPRASFLCAMCLFSSAFLITMSDFRLTDSHQPSFPSSSLIPLVTEGAHVSPTPRE